MRRRTRSCGRTQSWSSSRRWRVASRRRRPRGRERAQMPDQHRLIVSPVITQKSSAAYQARKEYAFRVDTAATKPQIRAAIEALFKVTVTDVRTLVVRAGAARAVSPAVRAVARPGKRRSSRSKKATRSPCSRADMGIRQFRPMTPGTRFRSVSDFAEITKSEPEKSLLEPLQRTGGRNNKGHITNRWQGGGHKRRYRRIDFRREKFGIPAKVAAVEYDPNRTSRIALLHYADGEKRYILAPKGLAVGDTVVSGPGSDIRVGNAMPLFEIPLGTTVHNVELKIGRGGQLARSAGTGIQVVAKEGNYVTLRLRSTEMRMVRGECLATIGEVGNPEHELLSIGKAGKSRWLGRNPRVRGVAMNPVDHPLGGGEGKTSGGRPPTNPWGKVEGKKTRHKKKPSSKLIVRGRKRGKATQ